MPKKFICTYNKKELTEIYNSEGMTIKKMCEIVGCKSDITMAKILKNYEIDTDHNSKLAFIKRGKRTNKEFKNFLIDQYLIKKKSMSNIAKELNISNGIIAKYLDKYEIPKRTKSEQQKRERSSNWRGGKGISSHGYIKIFMPEHPYASVAGYVYEHRLIMEKHIGRYLKPTEVVHHIDQNKQNNKIDNLLLLTNKNHVMLHRFLALWEKGSDH